MCDGRDLGRQRTALTLSVIEFSLSLKLQAFVQHQFEHIWNSDEIEGSTARWFGATGSSTYNAKDLVKRVKHRPVARNKKSEHGNMTHTDTHNPNPVNSKYHCFATPTLHVSVDFRINGVTRRVRSMTSWCRA